MSDGRERSDHAKACLFFRGEGGKIELPFSDLTPTHLSINAIDTRGISFPLFSPPSPPRSIAFTLSRCLLSIRKASGPRAGGRGTAEPGCVTEPQEKVAVRPLYGACVGGIRRRADRRGRSRDRVQVNGESLRVLL